MIISDTIDQNAKHVAHLLPKTTKRLHVVTPQHLWACTGFEISLNTDAAFGARLRMPWSYAKGKGLYALKKPRA